MKISSDFHQNQIQKFVILCVYSKYILKLLENAICIKHYKNRSVIFFAKKCEWYIQYWFSYEKIVISF